MIMSAIEQLTALQEELGYKEGELSTVAMLGLVGETGEVLAETVFRHDGSGTERQMEIRLKTIKLAKDNDDTKKRVRNGESDVCLVVLPEHLEKFKTELGDAFYYINILATNVGLTVFDLAQMAHDKIRRKQAEGGSSEDRKS